MTVHYYLRNGNVNLKVNWKGMNLIKAVGLKLPPEKWNEKRQRAVSGLAYAPGSDVNARLDCIERDLTDRYTAFVASLGRHPSKDEMRKLMAGHRVEQSQRLADYAREYVDRQKRKTNYRTGVTISRSTWMKQLNIIYLLEQFEMEERQIMLTDCDLKFYNDMVSWMVKMKYSLNTVGKTMSIIRSWIRQADSDGKQVHPAYRSTDWAIQRERTSHVSLSNEELQRMLDLNLTGGLEVCRDIFLIASYTGLRYSDISRLSSAIIRDNMLVMEQRKTVDEVVVPIHPVVQSIMERWKQRGKGLPAAPSNVQMNQLLKEIAREAGIADPVFRRITRGGVRVENKLPKWQLVTTHTARRSFAKNLYLSGFPLDYLSRIMGHRKPEQTLEYIGIDPIEKAQLLARHWAGQ